MTEGHQSQTATTRNTGGTRERKVYLEPRARAQRKSDLRNSQQVLAETESINDCPVLRNIEYVRTDRTEFNVCAGFRTLPHKKFVSPSSV